MNELLLEQVRTLTMCIMVLGVIDTLLEISQSKKVILLEFVYIAINLFCNAGLKQYSIELYGVLVVSIMFYAAIYSIYLGKRSFLLSVAVMMIAVITEGACAIATAVLTYGFFIFPQAVEYSQILMLLSNFLKLLFLIPIYLWNKKTSLVQYLNRWSAKMMVILLGCIFQLSRYYLYVIGLQKGNAMRYVFFMIAIMGIFTGAAWVIDWKLRDVERRQLWEDNKRMSSEIHRSKEIIPAIQSTLDRLVENRDNEELIQEIRQLCGEQMKESKAESMQEKQFPSTGVAVLDEQLKMFGQEAASRGINLDVFVADLVKPALKQQKIQEMDFLRLVGDLTRNAFRAVADETGNILIIFGYLQGDFQLEIYDDGKPFPEFVLEQFGKRGLTTGGTGNGLADILECVDKYQASYYMEEYAQQDTFTKEIRIVWDGKNDRVIQPNR